MATLTYGITVSEVQLDKDCEFVAEHVRDLPHARRIAEQARKSWNAIDFAGILDGVLGTGSIDKVPMTSRVDGDGSLHLTIRVTPRRGFRWSARRRNAVWEELDAQMVDGWGEGFFGYGNVMTDENGNKFCAETA